MKTLKLLKQSVVAVNKVLKDKVKTMGVVELLRNTHPIYRDDFARIFYKEGIITKEEAAKFIKLY